jgi:hypothetical protein
LAVGVSVGVTVAVAVSVEVVVVVDNNVEVNDVVVVDVVHGL